ncbi:ABC transporter permease [Isoptericola aurantiacus]|uniref:ABC transporter permease n=1 Tax=Isoptericola aurantiacus TaxID=3377839 RepID=UPI00383B590C
MLWVRIVRRVLLSAGILLGVTVIAFVLVRLAPGNPAAAILPTTATPAEVAAQEQRMGLDQPILLQYFIYLGQLLHGDLGYSYMLNASNASIILPRLANTAVITGIGVGLALVVAIPLGVLAGMRPGSLRDSTAVGFSLLGQAMSPVWLCLLMILVFSVWLKWLPPVTTSSATSLIMPSVCVGFTFCSLVTRMLRAGTIEVLGQDYITAARARGIGRPRIYAMYALKNGLLPVLTISGAQIGILLGGSVVVEEIFQYPGVGELTVQAISTRDLQLVQSIVVVAAVVMLLCNLVVDILNTVVDKRVKFN